MEWFIHFRGLLPIFNFFHIKMRAYRALVLYLSVVHVYWNAIIYINCVNAKYTVYLFIKQQQKKLCTIKNTYKQHETSDIHEFHYYYYFEVINVPNYSPCTWEWVNETRQAQERFSVWWIMKNMRRWGEPHRIRKIHALLQIFKIQHDISLRSPSAVWENI